MLLEPVCLSVCDVCWKGFSCCWNELFVAGKGLVVAMERVYSCCWNLSVCLYVMIAGKGLVVARKGLVAAGTCLSVCM